MAKSEHYEVAYFCADKCGESAPEGFGPENRSDTNGRQPSASWRTKTAGSIFRDELKAQEPGVPCPTAREDKMSQFEQREQICSSSTSLFYSSPQCIGEGHLLYSVY